MRTVVVSTRLFSTELEGDLEYCNGQPGSAFAEWIRESLSSTGLESDKCIQEDYGWGFWLQSNGCTIWICVSFTSETSGTTGDGESPEWHVSVNHEIPMLFLKPWLWFRKSSGDEEERKVFAIIKEKFDKETGITVLHEE